MATHAQLHAAYEHTKATCALDLRSQNAGESLRDLALLALTFLVHDTEQVELESRVHGKAYMSYRTRQTVARPANRALFVDDEARVADYWNRWQQGQLSADDLRKLVYTMALAPCLAMELFDRQNKKGPATYFECFVGHIFAKALNRNPDRRVTLPIEGRNVRLTMDFLFPRASNSPAIHLPVKMSTRERVVQAWAHQKLLDSAYHGANFRGILVLFSETKMDSRTLEVVEICVPDQWLAYQTHLAQMHRIYYFDVPQRYQALTDEFPNLISIRQFGDFFTEIDQVAQ
jgi:hypothetical protein